MTRQIFRNRTLQGWNKIFIETAVQTKINLLSGNSIADDKITVVYLYISVVYYTACGLGNVCNFVFQRYFPNVIILRIFPVDFFPILIIANCSTDKGVA